MYAPVEKTCQHCNTLYTGNPNSKYCGYDCSHASRKRRITLICQECNNEFERQDWNKDAKFCSFSCKTKHQSSEIIKVTCTNCSIIFDRKDHLVYRHKSGNSFCCKKCATDYNKGTNHYEWKEHLHDKNKKLALKQWATKIKERDEYTCQLCGETDRSLIEAHHMKNKSKFPELQFDFNNGISLCLKCHALQHINDPKSYRLIMYKINNNK